MAANKFSTERVNATIVCATDTVDIDELKKEQEQVIMSFVNGASNKELQRRVC